MTTPTTYTTKHGTKKTAAQARTIIEANRGHTCTHCEYSDCATSALVGEMYEIVQLAQLAGDHSGDRKTVAV